MARKTTLPQLHQLTRVDFTPWWLKLIICVLLVLATCAAFQGLRTHEFISYDDRDYITINMFDRDGLTWKDVKWAFNSIDTEGHWIAGNYHPLTWISHEIDISIFGIDRANVWHTGIASPGLHHLMDLFFHLINTVLLFLILNRLTGRLWAAAFVAALFALHPLHVQSVAWASERKDVLSTMFFMLTLMAYVAYVDRSGPVYRLWRSRSISWLFYLAAIILFGFVLLTDPHSLNFWVLPGLLFLGGLLFGLGLQAHIRTLFLYFLAYLLFGLGLLAKPMLVTLPVILILLDFWPLGRLKFAEDFAPDARPTNLAQLTRRERRSRDEASPPGFIVQLFWSIFEKLPFFVLTCLDAQQTHYVQGSAGAVVGENMISTWIRFQNALLAYAHYLRQILWPTDLSFFYSYRDTEAPEWFRDIAISAIVLILITSFVIYFGRKYRYLPVGWLWYLGMLVPVNGLFVQVGSQYAGDRYTYVPYVGVFFMLALGLGDLRKYLIERRPELKRALTIALAVLALGGLALCGWYTDIKLKIWQDDFILYPDALMHDPDNAVAHNNYGGMIYQQQARPKAEQAGRLTMEAQSLDAAYNQAVAEANRAQAEGRQPDAAKLHADAAKFHADAENKRAESAKLKLESDKLYQDAEDHFSTAVRLKPGYADALANLGMLTFERHGGQDVSFLPIAPNQAIARSHALALGSALTGKEPNGFQKTELCYLIALQVKPDHPGALNNIGNLYRSMTQMADAEEQKAKNEGRAADAQRLHEDVLRYRKASEARYRFAVRAKPDLLEAWANLAVFLESEYRRHLGEAQQLAQSQPVDAAAANKKADAAYNEAVDCYSRAIDCDPRSARVHGQVAMLLFERSHYAEALPQFFVAFQLGDAPPQTLASTAWILATASVDKLRDGKKAVELATQAVQMTKGHYPQALDALAAAFAECGRFDDAIHYEQQAIGAAQAAGIGQILPLFQQHYQAFQAHQPIRTPVVPLTGQ